MLENRRKNIEELIERLSYNKGFKIGYENKRYFIFFPYLSDLQRKNTLSSLDAVKFSNHHILGCLRNPEIRMNIIISFDENGETIICFENFENSKPFIQIFNKYMPEKLKSRELNYFLEYFYPSAIGFKNHNWSKPTNYYWSIISDKQHEPALQKYKKYLTSLSGINFNVKIFGKVTDLIKTINKILFAGENFHILVSVKKFDGKFTPMICYNHSFEKNKFIKLLYLFKKQKKIIENFSYIKKLLEENKEFRDFWFEFNLANSNVNLGFSLIDNPKPYLLR